MQNCGPGVQVKQRLAEAWPGTLSDMQKELLVHITAYRDVCVPLQTSENAAQIREMYCLHALNHVLKTRTKVIKNNERLREAAAAGKDIGYGVGFEVALLGCGCQLNVGCRSSAR